MYSRSVGVNTRFYGEQNIAHGLFVGEVSNEEILGMITEGLRGLDDARRKYIITDYTDASLDTLSSQQVRGNADQAKSSRYASQSVLLMAIAPRDLEYGLSRMWLAFAARGVQWDTELVRSRAAAQTRLAAEQVEISFDAG